MSSYLECLICAHDMGWHREKLGACLECDCGAFQFQPHETLAELERLQSLEIKADDFHDDGLIYFHGEPFVSLHVANVIVRDHAKSEFKREDLQNEAALDRGEE